MTDRQLDDLLKTARPFHTESGWYWGTKDDEPDPDGDEWRLPPEIMVLIPQRITYPDAKRFASETAAASALRAAVAVLRKQTKRGNQ
jgi:hypothetical protein